MRHIFLNVPQFSNCAAFFLNVPQFSQKFLPMRNIFLFYHIFAIVLHFSKIAGYSRFSLVMWSKLKIVTIP